MTHIVWILMIAGFHETIYLDNFSSKETCEAAFVSIQTQTRAHNGDDPETFTYASKTDVSVPYAHQCVEVTK